MQREAVLAGAIGAVVLASLLGALLVPGALATDGGDDPSGAEPSEVSFTELNVEPAEVSGGTVTLAVDLRLEHRGAASENLSVEFRAIDDDTALVETGVRKNVTSVEGDRELSVETDLDLEREGDYRLETLVYRDGERIVESSRRVRGVGSLEPAYADTPVQFHRFGAAYVGADLPVIEYSVEDVEGNRTRLDVSAHLTNTGDVTEEDVELVLKARQMDSNVVADQRRVEVGAIDPGRTATPRATLTVPDEYNYYLDGVLWRDGVIVGDARETAELAPTREVPENGTAREEVDVDTGEFAVEEADAEEFDAESSDGDGADRADESDDADRNETDGAMPGFGVATALAALLAALAAAHWRDTR